MKFRHDINALRALAVTAVVLFHYKVDSIPGGYVGVDVFFVISGYLMTTIIMGKLAKGKFSIWEFYYDRATRIVPGLMGMCFVLLAAGYFLLEPVTYHYLGSTSIAALLFFSNFQFWEATTYFDPQSDTKWLLHTWSLSVEWQFYLIYPIILIALHKFDKSRRHIVPILWSMAFLSLLLCIWCSKSEPASAFYLLPQRAWEMLAGGIVALQFKNGDRKYSWILLASGFVFTGMSIAFYDKNMPWPYYWALLPTIGTCLVIAANRPDTAAFKIPLVQTVGKWSYAIYLWHWPIAVTAIYFNFTTKTPLKIGCEIVILAAIIAGGGLLLSLLKKVSNGKLTERRLPGVLAGASALAVTMALAITVTTNEGLPNRRPDIARQLEGYAAAAVDWNFPFECKGRDPAGNLRPCRLGQANDRGTLIIGDSFAMVLYGRFAEQAKLNPENSFTFLAIPGCPPVIGMRNIQYPWNQDPLNCKGYFEEVLQFAEARHFKRIMLVANWYEYFNPLAGEWMCFETGGRCRLELEPSSYVQHLDAALANLGARLQELRNRGAEIVIVGAFPSGRWNVPVELAKRKFIGMDTTDIEYIDRDEFLKKAPPIRNRLMALALSVGGKFVDPLDFLCDSRRCPTVDKDGVSYFWDQRHFRSSAVKTSRFQFLDDAAGISRRLSAAPMPRDNNP